MNWITVDDLIITGGLPGVVNRTALESAVMRPLAPFLDVEMYLTLQKKIAALAHSIVEFHPFADGNKRVGLAAADVVLQLNGQQIVDSSSVEPFFGSIARGEQTIEQIASWLDQNTAPLTNN